VTVDDARAAQEWFLQFATRHTERDALYSRMGLVFAGDQDLASLLLAARPTQRNPPLVYAAIHHLLLGGIDHPLGEHYATIVAQPRTDDPEPALRDFTTTHRDAITHLVATRSTQTNSIERSTVLVVLLARLADEVGPLALVDVGTSGGSTLLLDRCTHHYVQGRAADTVDVDVLAPASRPQAGSPGHRVVASPDPLVPPLDLVTVVDGAVPVPARMPDIAWRLGIDRSPADLADPDEFRWLLACVWPGDLPRFRRLQRALDHVRSQGLPVRRADAVDDLDAVLALVPPDLHACLTTSWVMNYLTPERQATFLAGLDEIGTRRDLTLVTFESPRRTPGLVVPQGWEERDETVLGWYRWRDGRRHVEHVATAHAHGRWIQWWGEPIVAPA